jgi:hypothetical protein
MERAPRHIDSDDERYVGYAILGVTFASGDVLALRRFPSTSGPHGYTSVWHRAPNGRWTFYADVGPCDGCAKYFRPQIDEVIVAPIRLEWVAPRTLAIAIEAGRRLAWSVTATYSVATDVLNGVLRVLPDSVWQNDRRVSTLETLAGHWLHAGRVRLSGRTPSGHHFVARPHVVWPIETSRARMAGRDLGEPARLVRQAAVGDYWIPRRGLFVLATAVTRPAVPA